MKEADLRAPHGDGVKGFRIPRAVLAEADLIAKQSEDSREAQPSGALHLPDARGIRFLAWRHHLTLSTSRLSQVS